MLMYNSHEACNAIAAAIALDLPKAIASLAEHDSAKYNIHAPCADMRGLPIHVAAANGKLKCVKQLHALGAYLDDGTCARGTPVNLAARWKQMAVLKYLKKNGLLGCWCERQPVHIKAFQHTHKRALNKRTGCDMTPAATHLKKSVIDKL